MFLVCPRIIIKLLGYADCKAIAFICNKSNALYLGSMLKYIFHSSFFIFSFTSLSSFSLISRRINRLVGRKREYPEKKELTHPQAELGLSHMTRYPSDAQISNTIPISQYLRNSYLSSCPYKLPYTCTNIALKQLYFPSMVSNVYSIMSPMTL